jgi:plasmid maintenance system killer protein
VEILYRTNKLKEKLTVAHKMQKAFGAMAKKVSQRMSELKAAPNLEVMKTIPGANCHQLKGDRQGEFAVDISGNFRLIFEPYHNPVPRKDDKSIDCIKITDILILGTKDYH